MKIPKAKMFNVAILPVNKIKIFEVTQKNLIIIISALLFLSSICFIPSIQATGPLFTYMFVNASNNVNWANNIEPSTGPNPTINSVQGSCSSTIAFINSQTCVLSNQGVFFTHGTSMTSTKFVSTLTKSVFADHNVNTLLIRKYFNLMSALYLSDSTLYTTYLTLSFPAGRFVRISDYFETTASRPNPLSIGFSVLAFVGDASSRESFLTTPDASNFRITSSTWMDISITYEYAKNAVGKISFQVKFYSQKATYSMASTNTAHNNPNYEISQLAGATIAISNDHIYDFTLQYLSVYGGAQTIDYINTAFCPVTSLVPPEYCVDTQVSYLSNMCTTTVGGTCVSDCWIQNIGNCSKIIIQNYTYPFSNPQIVGVMIGVSVGTDALLFGIYRLLRIYLYTLRNM